MPDSVLEEGLADTDDVEQRPAASSRRPLRRWLYPVLVVAAFMMGLLTSSIAWRRPSQTVSANIPGAEPETAARPNGSTVDFAALMQQVNPPQGYRLPASYGDLGPRLVLGGAIDYNAFAAVFQSSGEPLTPAQVDILRTGSSNPIVITSDNAHFLLNFFWAVGLANKNRILTDGPMVQNDGGHIENFASTGGWTLGTKPVTELYASMDLIPLTAEQQARLEQVAAAVYRPCCGNPTLFPDCNHGMAMLGLLELMASGDASAEQMFAAAKYVNAYWFPQQSLEAAIYLKATQNLDFAQADGRVVSGQKLFSGVGAGRLHALLQSEGLLPAAPGSGGGCGT